VKGPEGNIEYLALLTNQLSEKTISHNDIEEIVEASHSQLIG
jgi:hypothetical protein